MATRALTLTASPRTLSRLFSTTSLSSLFTHHKKTKQKQLSPKPDATKPKQQSFLAPQPSSVLAAQRQSLFDPNVDPPKRLPHPLLYVYGLNKCTTTERLREAFSKFGKVVSAKIIRDKVLRKSRGFGYVKYSTTEEAAKGIKGMDEQLLDGWVIFAEYARRTKRPIKNIVKLPETNAKLPNQHSKKEQEKRKRRLTTLKRLKREKKKMNSAKLPQMNTKCKISV